MFQGALGLHQLLLIMERIIFTLECRTQLFNIKRLGISIRKEKFVPLNGFSST